MNTRMIGAFAGLLLLQTVSSSNLRGGEPAGDAGKAPEKAWTTITCAEPLIGLAPYVWKCTGTGATARAEATMPGAYLRVTFQRSTAIGLLIDGAANNDCPAAAMPVVEHSLDGGAFKATQLVATGKVYALPLADGLDASQPHRIEFFFRAAHLGPKRWESSTVHLRIAGLQLDTGGLLLPTSRRAKTAIGFGDSITEGVCVEGPCPYYSNLLMNNARVTWFPIVCAALRCEYGQLGTGGQGMVTTSMAIPPLPLTWDRYDAATSRLIAGRLTPEPDYVFCEMGTNDYDDRPPTRQHLDITAAYLQWLSGMRTACPNAHFFCVTPPLGWHASQIAEAVKERTRAGDLKVHLIDTAPLKSGFNDHAATQLADDGVHPSIYGNALLGALIARQAQKALGPEE